MTHRSHLPNAISIGSSVSAQLVDVDYYQQKQTDRDHATSVTINLNSIRSNLLKTCLKPDYRPRFRHVCEVSQTYRGLFCRKILRPIDSGVLLKMEVGIRKGAWQRDWRYPAYLWSLRWVYAVKKTPEVGIRCIPAYTPQYTTVYRSSRLRPGHRLFLSKTGFEQDRSNGIWKRQTHRLISEQPIEMQLRTTLNDVIATYL